MKHVTFWPVSAEKKTPKLKAARKHGKCLCHWVSFFSLAAPCLSSSKQLRETDEARHARLQTPVQEPRGAEITGANSICSSCQSDETKSWTCLRAHAVYLQACLKSWVHKLTLHASPTPYLRGRVHAHASM